MSRQWKSLRSKLLPTRERNAAVHNCTPFPEQFQVLWKAYFLLSLLLVKVKFGSCFGLKIQDYCTNASNPMGWLRLLVVKYQCSFSINSNVCLVRTGGNKTPDQ